MTEVSDDVWLHCSACRKGVPFGAIHWVCSVSTCNRARTQLVFCSVSCWDSHVATLRHRDSWAVEARAPTRAEAAAGRGSSVNDYPEAFPTLLASEEPTQPLGRPTGLPPSTSVGPPRRIVSPVPSVPSVPPSSSSSSPRPSPVPPTAALTSTADGPVAVPVLSASFERDILVVVSKLKKYIKDRSGMNTSDAVVDGLSEHVRAVCDDAIRAAAADGRKTVLDRDVPRPRR